MSNEQKNNVQKQEEPGKMKESKSDSFSWKKLLGKKWVFPAMYMAAAVIILTLMWVYQDSANESLSNEDVGLSVDNGKEQGDKKDKPNAVAVTAQPETMQWPVADVNEVKQSVPFYDSQASSEVKQAAMVEYDDTLTPHMAVDFEREDNQTFDVVAALSGEVTLVENHALVGNQVEITHENGLKTIYQSLGEIKVKQGDEVQKGAVIAKAGRNDLEKDEGVHLHFEVQQNGQPVNPKTFMNQN